MTENQPTGALRARRGEPDVDNVRRRVMRIAFASIDALPDAIATFDPTTVVSIWTPQHPVRPIEDRDHWHLPPFDDVEERSADTLGKVLPGRQHVDALIDVLGAAPPRLLVHCVAGLSRSPALAIVAAVHDGCDPVIACASVVRSVPHAQPNRLLLQCADDVIGSRILAVALETFAYTRGRGWPKGDRAGWHEISC